MEIDRVDRGILYLLQRDARRLTTGEMGERVGVAASTVRNRIERLEDDGVIRGYSPRVDYDEAGLQLHVEVICRAEKERRSALVDEARSIDGVVAIREVLDGDENVQIDVVGLDCDDLARVTDSLEDLGLEVADTKLIKETRTQPLSHFADGVEDADD